MITVDSPSMEGIQWADLYLVQYHRMLSALLRQDPIAIQRDNHPVKEQQRVLPYGTLLKVGLFDGTFFPYLNTRPFSPRLAVEEIGWMLSGSQNVKDLHKRKVHFWDKWAKEDGDLGPVYGAQWRTRTDQVRYVMEELERHGYTRRALLSAWNPKELEEMALPPCHFAWQAFLLPPKDMDSNAQEIKMIFDGERRMRYENYIERRKTTPSLMLHVFMRSWDTVIGGPFNVAGYAFLCMALAQALNVCAEGMSIHASHVHMYESHVPFAEKMIESHKKIVFHEGTHLFNVDEEGVASIAPSEGETALDRLLSFGYNHITIKKPIEKFNPDDFRNIPVFV